ncbi:hypothetical protein WICPIJ_003373 [Wickerhamomyces pijperi]|uniref:Phospholipase C/D domain-containing protein n=1 Tax=Wickerhamomyces pijperi TaxID=599730 RepID=A0A9P8TP93_WICPI|nr:hypothetical protein WICPIJ_003373 [Wickerhamomyces pijperi]
MNLASTLLCLFLQVIVTETAGVALHSYLVSLVHHELPKDIQSEEYLPFLISGSFLPDAFYTCGNPELSEEIHWPDFLRVAVDYYRNITDTTSTSVSDPEKLKLKAFLYGVFTHQVSDSTWHSLGVDEGLLRVISQLEFTGDEEAAHRYIDVAGDFIMLGDLLGNGLKFNTDSLKYFTDHWEYPDLNLLVDIFKIMGYEDTSYYSVFYCLERGKLAIRSEIAVLEEFEVLYSLKSPWFVDNWRNYYEGGVEDWQYSTIRCLGRLQHWFENGPDDGKLCGAILKNQNINPTDTEFEPCEHGDCVAIRPSEGKDQRSSVDVSPLVPHSQFGGNLLVGDFGIGGNEVLAVSAVGEDNYKGSVYLLPLSDILSQSKKKKKTKDSLQMVLSDGVDQMKKVMVKDSFQHASKFGVNLQEYSPFGSLSLLLTVSTTPGQFIQVFHQTQLLLTIESDGDSSKFGHSGNILQSVSFSTIHNPATGYEDLVIGLPYFTYSERGSSSEGSATERGTVMVLSGERFAYYALNDSIDKVKLEFLVASQIYIPRELKVRSSSSGEAGFEHFGSALSVIETPSRPSLVLIGAESLGLVSVFTYDSTKDADQQFALSGVIDYESNFVRKGQISSRTQRVPSAESSLFASKYIEHYKYFNETYILISSHGSSGTIAKLSGSIIIMKLTNDSEGQVGFELFRKVHLRDIPENSLVKFGEKIFVSDQFLTISSGRCVYHVPLDEIHSEDNDNEVVLDDSFSIRCTTNGKSGYASAIAVYHNRDHDDGSKFVIIGDDLFGKEQLMNSNAMNIGRINIIGL